MSRILMLMTAFTFSAALTAFGAGPYQGPIQGPIHAKSQGASLPICCDRAIDYKYHHPRREPCGPRQELVVLVKDPCACCLVQVPLCIPACCQGEPEVCSRRGILGREVVEYNWCCGYRVKVVFDRHGCVTVHYNV